MLKGKAIIHKHPNANTFYMSLPAKITSDSQFPLKDGMVVDIEVDDGRVILYPSKGERE